MGKLRELKQSGVDLSGTDEVRVRGARCEEVEWGHSAMQYLTWRGVLRCVLTCGDVRWCSVCMCVHQYGDTPAHLAAKGGHENALRALHELGADLSAKNEVRGRGAGSEVEWGMAEYRMTRGRVLRCVLTCW